MGKHKLGFVAFDSAKEKHALQLLTTGAIAKCAIWVRSTIRQSLLMTTLLLEVIRLKKPGATAPRSLQ
jgi:hypothetical protein